MAVEEFLRLGWLQWDLVWEDPQANCTRVEALLAEAPPADVWVLPEMWSTGFSMATDQAEPEGGPSWRAMQTWAERYGALFIGSLRVRTSKDVRNRAYAVYPDGKAVFYDKRHLFRLAQEDRYYAAGDQQVLFSWKGWQLAVQICYDLRFPVWSRRTPRYAYDVLIYVANWPAVRHLHWEQLLPARAIENQSYVLGVNRLGRDGHGHLYRGGSVLYDFRGAALLSSGQAEGAFVQAIAFTPLQAYRDQFPAWRDADGFEFLPPLSS